ncbi:MAG TPA: biosynthetic-type acetolactate synthase large subunit [Thermoplasmata archaeon]|nr:biosynthetic-type acetolactate synthase large subunit [Thermoplasmata archaeon]
MDEVSGAELVLDSLKKENVNLIFGIPGGVLLSLYDRLYDEDQVNHILFRHEQCAAHAADGYARASGKVGVCLATSGPGAMNLITGLATANIDSSPVVALTGQVSTKALGTDAFQEADTFTVTMPVTKHNFLVKDVKDLPGVVRGAFYLANTGRKGVVLVDLPMDVLEQKVRNGTTKNLNFMGYKPNLKPNGFQLKKAANALVNSERPLILAGGGVISSMATEELRAIAEHLGAGVVTTLMGKGAISEVHPLSLGMAGMHGRVPANNSIAECDVLLSVGTRFSDRTTGWRLEKFAPSAIKIDINIDPSEINKNVQVDVPVTGDAKAALGMLLEFLKDAKKKNESKEWTDRLREMHDSCTECIKGVGERNPIDPRWAVKEICGFLDNDAIVTTEVGQCQMYAAHYYTARSPRQFITSGGLGTMGFGFPAAIGAKLANPDKQVVDIAGDGSFLMTCQDLATCIENDIPVVVCILHNGHLGMIRQWQDLFYGKRYSSSNLGVTPDFVKLAEAFGAYGERIEKTSDLRGGLKNAFSSGKPAVLDIMVDEEDNVLPMIPRGGAIDKMVGVEKCRCM